MARRLRQLGLAANDPNFLRFWAAYPRRVAKVDALQAWSELMPDEALVDTMLEALSWQTKSRQWTRDEGEAIPYPATWVRGRRWEDERPTTLKPTGVPAHRETPFQRARRLGLK